MKRDYFFNYHPNIVYNIDSELKAVIFLMLILIHLQEIDTSLFDASQKIKIKEDYDVNKMIREASLPSEDARKYLLSELYYDK